MTEFNAAQALDRRASRDERRQVKVEKVGRGLASYAIRQANEGKIGVEVKAKAGRFLGRTAFINRNPEVYQSANNVLAEEGLIIAKTGEAWHPYPTIFSPHDFDLMTINLTDASQIQDIAPQESIG